MEEIYKLITVNGLRVLSTGRIKKSKKVEHSVICIGDSEGKFIKQIDTTEKQLSAEVKKFLTEYKTTKAPENEKSTSN